MPTAMSARLVLLGVMMSCGLSPAVGQNAAAGPVSVEQRIQHVTSGLIGGVVLSGQEHATHTLADRMKALNVPGVSIAVIHEGKIEWARGFGLREVGGAPVNAETMFSRVESVARESGIPLDFTKVRRMPTMNRRMASRFSAIACLLAIVTRID